MKRSSLLLTLALSCVLPLAALAKEPHKQKEPTPSMTKQQTEALSKCMQQCQQPMKGCMESCHGDDKCNTKCGNNFSQCIVKTCGDLMPDSAKSDY